MSRGLGRSQRAILTAMRELEVLRGETDGFRVWIVLEQVWNSTLRARREAEAEARRADRATYRKELEAAAAAGDAEAASGLRNLMRMDFIAGSLRRRPGPTQCRPPGSYLEDINPSRTFALLAKRGLVSRHQVRPGPGAWIALTDEGRRAAAKLGEAAELPAD